MSWEYGTLASEVYELDKPVGRWFADLQYYTHVWTCQATTPPARTASRTRRT